MVSKISDLLIDNVEVGDPPVSISLLKLTLDVRKKKASDVVSEPVSSHIGSQKIDGQLNVLPGTCVVSQVLLGLKVILCFLLLLNSYSISVSKSFS